MNSKASKKSQFDGVIQAIFEVIKLSLSFIAFISVCIFLQNKILIVLALSFLVYYLYLVIQSKSYGTLKKYYQRVKKYQTLHYLFQSHQKSKSRASILPFFDDEIVQRKRNFLSAGRQTQQDENNTDNFALHAVPIYVPKQSTKKQFFSRSTEQGSMSRTSEKVIEQFTKEQDKQFQRCLKDFNKDIKREQLQYLADQLSNRYTGKILHLLKLHENNMRQVREEMEKNYHIKIYEGELLDKSNQLVNVSIDDVLQRMSLLRQRESFPWAERNDKDETAKNQHFYRVNNLVRERKSIDFFLSPYYPLNHKLRQEVVFSLKSYKPGSIITSSTIVNTVSELYNDTLKSSKTKESYFLIREDHSTQSCIQYSQSFVDIYCHVDLTIKRKGKQDLKIKCPFGQQNLWIALAFAVHILQSKR